MKIAMRLVLAGVLIAGVGAVGAGTAQAAAGCSPGYACSWQHPDFNSGQQGAAEWGNSAIKGNFYSTSGTKNRNDMASSIHANGGDCRATRWYEDGNQKGTWVELKSQQRGLTPYKDSYLGNGAGASARNFDNMATSYKFLECA